MGTIFRQKGRHTWMLKYYRNGRPVYESSGTDVYDEAKKALRKIEHGIDEGEAPTKNARILRFDEAVKDVENDYVNNKRGSLSNVKSRIKLHLIPFFGGRRLAAITSADIRAYQAARLEAGAKAATVN